METLQRWLNSKGNNAATSLATILRGLGLDPATLVAAVEEEALATRVAELAPALAELEAAGVDLVSVAREQRGKIVAEQAAQKQEEALTRE